MTADTMRPKALACLRESRVLIRHAEVLAGPGPRPTVVIALVRSSRDENLMYRIDLHNGGWRCSCRATDCGHLLATKMVTGWAA